MLAYNHEKHIAQAIEGVVMQKANFPFELVIGEDKSTDNTAGIINEYAVKYPEIIKVLSHNSNLGAFQNTIKTIQECKGKYLALCEGDDYWTDPFKLQKQVDFLESHPDFSVCFHNTKIYYETENRFSDYDFVKNIPEITDINYLARGNYIPTQTVMYRSNDNVVRELLLVNTSMTDYPLAMLHAKYGKIKKFHETMSVYRVHEGGCYKGMDINNMPNSLRMLEDMFPLFEKETVDVMMLHYSQIVGKIIDYYISIGDYNSAKKAALDFSKINSSSAHDLLFYKFEKSQKELLSIKKSKYFKLYNLLIAPFKKLRKS